MWDSPTSRRTALQALLALGGGLTMRELFAEPNVSARIPGMPEDLVGRNGRSRTAVRRPHAPRSHRPRDDPREGQRQGPFSFRDRHRRQPLDAGAASRQSPEPAGIGGPQRHAQWRHRRRRSAHGRGRQHRDRRIALREAGPAGHLHFHHGQRRRHSRCRRFPGSAHRRRLQARPRERARVEWQAAPLQHGHREARCETSTDS